MAGNIQVQSFHIPLMFRVEADSRDEAARFIYQTLDPQRGVGAAMLALRQTTESGQVVEPFKEWWLPEPALQHIDGNTHTGLVLREPDALTDVFEGSPIPEILAGMFPPQPKTADYLDANGQVDDDRYERAHEQWREACLDLAIAATSLPDSRSAGEAGDSLRGRLAELVSEPLPVEPQKDDYLVSVNPQYEGEYEDVAYRFDHTQWTADFIRDAHARLGELEKILNVEGIADPKLPSQFEGQRIPAELLVVEMLRTIAYPNDYAHARHRPYSAEQLTQLQAMLQAVDPEITVPHTDDPDGPPVYEGPASNAHAWLVPGIYPATGIDGNAQFRLVIGSAAALPGGTASAAFRTDQHDTQVLDRIADILKNYRTEQPPADTLRTINDTVTPTGRIGIPVEELQPHLSPPRERGNIGFRGTLRLEDGILLSDLLAQRERDLGAADNISGGRRDGQNLGRDL